MLCICKLGVKLCQEKEDMRNGGHKDKQWTEKMEGGREGGRRKRRR